MIPADTLRPCWEKEERPQEKTLLGEGRGSRVFLGPRSKAAESELSVPSVPVWQVAEGRVRPASVRICQALSTLLHVSQLCPAQETRPLPSATQGGLTSSSSSFPPPPSFPCLHGVSEDFAPLVPLAGQPPWLSGKSPCDGGLLFRPPPPSQHPVTPRKP